LMLLAFYIVVRVSLRLLLGKNKRDIMQDSLPMLQKLRSLVHGTKYYLPMCFTNPSLCILSRKGVSLMCFTEEYPFINDMWREIWVLDAYEKYFKIKNGLIVIDVGAHIGIFSIKAAKEVGKNGLIIAMEPHPLTYALLKTNLKQNRCENVIPIRMAASNFKGKAKLYLYHHSGGHSIAIRRSEGFVAVSVDRLDSIVRELNLGQVDLMKIDVEGAGLQVLEGTEKILEEFKPKLSIAVYHVAREREGIVEFLSSRGYCLLDVDSLYIYAYPKPIVN